MYKIECPEPVIYAIKLLFIEFNHFKNNPEQTHIKTDLPDIPEYEIDLYLGKETDLDGRLLVVENGIHARISVNRLFLTLSAIGRWWSGPAYVAGRLIQDALGLETGEDGTPECFQYHRLIDGFVLEKLGVPRCSTTFGKEFAQAIQLLQIEVVELSYSLLAERYCFTEERTTVISNLEEPHA